MYIPLRLFSLGLLAALASGAAAAAEAVSAWAEPAPGLAVRDAQQNNADSSGGSGDWQKYKHFACGTNITHASPAFLSAIQQLHTNKLNADIPGAAGSYNYRFARKLRRQTSTTAAGTAASSAATPAAAKSIAVDTYFHVVMSAANAKTITQQMASDQLKAMNAAYNKYGIKFNLKATDFTTNDTWAAGASSADDTAMKTKLRKGTYASLNIYFQTDLSGDVLGKCTLPAKITGYVPPSAYVSDGCNVNANTMPGGNFQMYNQGQTAVHETGHWLGLLHVFEGYSCDPSNQGDLISDTPQQSISTDGCPTSPVQDSCPSLPGVDSIHNIMDYSWDSCYTGFSQGQAQRMLTLWPQFRQGY